MIIIIFVFAYSAMAVKYLIIYLKKRYERLCPRKEDRYIFVFREYLYLSIYFSFYAIMHIYGQSDVFKYYPMSLSD